MGELLKNYDVWGAIWTTIQLAVLSAIGATVIGTIVAIMRVSPVAVLRGLGTSYVNIFRNTPLTVLLTLCVLGLSLLVGLQLSQDLSKDAFRWAVVGLSAYHAAFVCEAIRSGVNTVPAGQAVLQNVKVVSAGSPAPTPTVPGSTPTTPAPSGRPDLVVTDISWSPANPAPGSAVTLKATIKNQGDAPTPAGVKHGVLFTFDDGAAGSGIWSDAHSTSIAPGAWVTVTANGGSAGSTWKAIAGTHTVKAHVDDVNRIAEENENNNVMAKEIIVGTSPAPTRGDLNGDGSVDWIDVIVAADMAQGKVTPATAADFDGNGTVDWKDVALLADFFFGRTASL